MLWLDVMNETHNSANVNPQESETLQGAPIMKYAIQATNNMESLKDDIINSLPSNKGRT